MKINILIAVLFTLLVAFKANGQTVTNDELIGTWFHSFEEENSDILTFRPEGYNLPAAEGRGKIEFKPDGVFLSREVSPDNTSEKAGSYTLNTATETLTLEYSTKVDDQTTERYLIILVMDEILLLQALK